MIDVLCFGVGVACITVALTDWSGFSMPLLVVGLGLEYAFIVRDGR